MESIHFGQEQPNCLKLYYLIRSARQARSGLCLEPAKHPPPARNRTHPCQATTATSDQSTTSSDSQISASYSPPMSRHLACSALAAPLLQCSPLPRCRLCEPGNPSWLGPFAFQLSYSSSLASFESRTAIRLRRNVKAPEMAPNSLPFPLAGLFGDEQCAKACKGATICISSSATTTASSTMPPHMMGGSVVPSRPVCTASYGPSQLLECGNRGTAHSIHPRMPSPRPEAALYCRCDRGECGGDRKAN